MFKIKFIEFFQSLLDHNLINHVETKIAFLTEQKKELILKDKNIYLLFKCIFIYGVLTKQIKIEMNPLRLVSEHVKLKQIINKTSCTDISLFAIYALFFFNHLSFFD